METETPVSLRCTSGSSSDWPGGSPGEPLGTPCCLPWPRAVTGLCPGLSRPQPRLPHCQPQSPPARPVSCPAQRPLPGPCPSPQVRPGLEGRRKWLGAHGGSGQRTMSVSWFTQDIFRGHRALSYSLTRSPQCPVEQLVVLILQLRRPRLRKSKGTASWQSGQAKNSGLLTASPGLQK